ncbi:hypothetical protein TNCV_4210971 [Trichonephila clavipes]|nr:hypothetical protein TNCV_4210971 [Trichonephila clavipes]
MSRVRSRNAYQHIYDFDKGRIDGNTERRAGAQHPSVTSIREDKHITRMALSDRGARSRALSQELESIARPKVSAQTV